MNNRKIARIIISSISIIMSFYFMFFTNEQSAFYNASGVWEIPLLLVLTIFLYINKNNTRKNKFIYNVVTYTLVVISLFFIVVCGYSFILTLFNSNASYDIGSGPFILIYQTILFIILFSNLFNFKSNSNKISDYLEIVVSLIVILIHVRFYVDPNLYNGNNTYNNDYGVYYYVMQNYIYIFIMYLTIIIQKIFVKEKDTK